MKAADEHQQCERNRDIEVVAAVAARLLSKHEEEH
jgi:hypothetical protein